MADLTPKQRRFVEEYLSNGRNGTAAYRVAFGAKGSEATARVNAARLLKHANIVPLLATADARVEKRTEKVLDRYALSRERILLEWARIGLSDIRDVTSFGPDGVSVRRDSELTDGAAAAISEVSETNGEGGRTMKIKMHGKIPALTALSKHFGLLDPQPQDDDAIEQMADDPPPPRLDRGETG